jgi:hypothetical protein
VAGVRSARGVGERGVGVAGPGCPSSAAPDGFGAGFTVKKKRNNRKRKKTFEISITPLYRYSIFQPGYPHYISTSSITTYQKKTSIIC